jgi:hypothetical protein
MSRRASSGLPAQGGSIKNCGRRRSPPSKTRDPSHMRRVAGLPERQPFAVPSFAFVMAMRRLKDAA